MRSNYDFSRARRNPYAARLKRQVTMRLDRETITYFRKLADETALPYQTLISSLLHKYASGRLKEI